ncbi:MAG: OmpH family outer membrane protein [Cytophagaceae bacterium]|nr:OmpH family outer membrane protein [Cytophagaceae bacterium]
MRTRIFLLLLPFIWQAHSAFAQKFGYIDSEYILSKMPEMQKANAEMERFANRWSKEVSDRQTEIERLERAFKAEEPLLTDDMKQQRRKTIEEKESTSRDFTNKVFGFDGMYLQKRKELMKPALDEVYKALDKVARQRQLQVVFDKASEGIAMIYTNPVHDYSDYVLEELGIDVKNSTPTNPTSTKITGKQPK